MGNSKGSKSLSLFKIVFLVTASLHFDHFLIYFICALLLIMDDWKYALIYLLLVAVILFVEHYRIDFINIGIVEDIKGNSCIVNKFFYNIRIDNINDIQYGDVLFFNRMYEKNQDIDELRRNVLFVGTEYKNIFNTFLNRYIRNRISTYDEKTLKIINEVIYHKYSYDDELMLGYGIASYYFFKQISDRNRYISLFLIFMYSILFQFEVKFLLMIIDMFIPAGLDKYYKFSIKLIAIIFINRYLIYNYSFMIPILFSLFSLFEMPFDFRVYICLIESIFFNQIDVFHNFIYRYMIGCRILLFLLCLLTIVFKQISFILILFADIMTFINSCSITIRGSITVLGLLFVYMIVRTFSINSNLIKYAVILSVLISPLNDPFFHVTFIDVGQGDSCLISYGLKRGNILIDTGSVYNYYKLKKEMFRQGIYDIDYLIISHDDSDHNGNIDNLKKDFNIRKIITTGESFTYKGIRFDHLDLGSFDNDNDNSLVYLIDIDGLKFLFTGDISIEAEKILLRKYYPLNIDFLKLAHHGSYTSSSEEFISLIKPVYSIISTSGLYGHPHEEVLERLDRYGSKYYTTKEHGTIKIYFSRLFHLLKTAHNEFVIIR